MPTVTTPTHCGDAQLLADGRVHGRGIVIALLQPAEETSDGTRGMVDDGLARLLAKVDVALAQHVLPVPAGRDAIRRIVTAECQASGSPKDPEFELFDRFPLTSNDDDTTARVSEAFTAYFGNRCRQMPQQTASVDFSEIPAALGALHLLGHR